MTSQTTVEGSSLIYLVLFPLSSASQTFNMRMNDLGGDLVKMSILIQGGA